MTTAEKAMLKLKDKGKCKECGRIVEKESVTSNNRCHKCYMKEILEQMETIADLENKKRKWQRKALGHDEKITEWRERFKHYASNAF